MSSNNQILSHTSSSSRLSPQERMKVSSGNSESIFQSQRNEFTADYIQQLNVNSMSNINEIPCKSSSSSTQIDNEQVVASGSTENLQTAEEDTCVEITEENNILSAFWCSGKLGAAYINLNTNELYILYEVIDINPDFVIFQNLFRQVQPRHLITGANTPQIFIEIAKQLTGVKNSEDSREDDQTDADRDSGTSEDPRCGLFIVNKKEYNYDACFRRIQTINLNGCPQDASEEERSFYLASIVPLQLLQTVHALGALLKHVDVYCSSGNQQNQNEVLPTFTNIHIISLKDQMMIDTGILYALQVFSNVDYRAGVKKKALGSYKQGISIFGIFNKCKSKLGTNHMIMLFQQPTYDPDILNARYDMISWCMSPMNKEIVLAMVSNLSRISNVNLLIPKIKKMTATAENWKTLINTVNQALAICEICSGPAEFAGCPSLLLKMAEEIKQTSMTHEVAYTLDKIIDLEETMNNKRFVVKPGLDTELDRKKQMMSSLREPITEAANLELQRLPDYVTECNIIYIPTIGYLLAVRKWADEVDPHQLENDSIRFMFTANTVIHYKTPKCQELDLLIGDLYTDIASLEERIQATLVEYLSDRLAPLQKIITLCGELDCLIALSDVASENNYCRPLIVPERSLDIKGGRHPLLELCSPQYTPNDTVCNSRSGFMKILTGPNACGKSAYLKQVALIVYLAHVGSFVPADSAKIGLVEQMHSRMLSTESVSMEASTFLIDSRQMSLALQAPTRSLLIIDEFGKGTTSKEGLSLLAACLQRLLNREAQCPITLVSTHFHHVADLLKPSPYVKLETFQYTLEESGNLTFLFKLVDGNTTESFACAITKAQKINSHIVNRGNKILEAQKTKTSFKEDPSNDNLLVMKLALEILPKEKPSTLQDVMQKIIQLQNNLRRT